MRVLSVLFLAMSLTAGTAGAQEPQVFGDLAEVMRGILFPNSNIIFDAQTNNPDAPVEAVEGDSTSERFANIYTGWEALENAAVALVEAANLIELPRNCELDEDEPGRIGAPAPDRARRLEAVRRRSAGGGTDGLRVGAGPRVRRLRRHPHDRRGGRGLLELPRRLSRQLHGSAHAALHSSRRVSAAADTTIRTGGA